MTWLTGAGCGSCKLENPEFDVVSLADRQYVQADLTPATKALWVASVKRFPGQIELIGGVGDAAHAKRKSCHNVLRDSRGRLLEGAKALDMQPVGIVGSPKFIALGNEQTDWIWENRATNGATVQIWRRRIRSIYAVDRHGKPNPGWRLYKGLNGHFKHHHTSVACRG